MLTWHFLRERKSLSSGAAHVGPGLEVREAMIITAVPAMTIVYVCIRVSLVLYNNVNMAIYICALMLHLHYPTLYNCSLQLFHCFLGTWKLDFHVVQRRGGRSSRYPGPRSGQSGTYSANDLLRSLRRCARRSWNVGWTISFEKRPVSS